MPTYTYRIVNVFAEKNAPQPRLTGNPLCVFEDARGMDDRTRQALALQFNLSETVFVLPSDKAAARIRIYTPAYEMPFAGHPTLGSAHVVRALQGAGDLFTLETGAGVIPVCASGDDWTLKAKAPHTRALAQSNEVFAGLLGLHTSDLRDTPLWVNTGSEQLVVPLASADAVRRAHPDPAGIATLAQVDGAPKVYVWAESGNDEVLARFFLLKHGALLEDFGTGSAAANLGGWFVARRAKLPLKRLISQGEPIGRPARLALEVNAESGIHVSGRVIELGTGSVTL
jgi:trans-2,3-dihydro-3-hydroxyanthranilate isomerase